MIPTLAPDVTDCLEELAAVDAGCGFPVIFSPHFLGFSHN
jgi:hypothetical protein